MNITYLRVPEELTCQQLRPYEKFISPQRQRRALAISSDDARAALLMAGLLVHYCLSIELQVPPEETVLTSNAFGKPLLRSNTDDSFSLTHSRGINAVATHSAPIGIDLENFNREPRKNVADRFFLEKEQEFLANSPNYKEDFFRVWTRKEAYVKMLGTGFNGMSPRSFDVFDLGNKAYFHTEVFEDFLLTVCTDEPIAEPPVIMQTTVDEVLNYYQPYL